MSIRSCTSSSDSAQKEEIIVAWVVEVAEVAAVEIASDKSQDTEEDLTKDQAESTLGNLEARNHTRTEDTQRAQMEVQDLTQDSMMSGKLSLRYLFHHSEKEKNYAAIALI